MKKILSFNLLLVLILGAFNLHANNPLPEITKKYSDQEIEALMHSFRANQHVDTIPGQEVISKFIQQFPKAKNIEWERGGKILEVEFEIGRYDYDAYYDLEGTLIMYEAEIAEADLPAIVKNTALGKHPKFRFEDVKIVKLGTQTTYKVELENRATGVDVKMVIDEKGVIISEKFDY